MHAMLGDYLDAEWRPCCFDDITKLAKGEATCMFSDEHEHSGCHIKRCNWFFCSSSCKDLSKANNRKGGSAEAYFAITDIIHQLRPDIVFYENVAASESSEVSSVDGDLGDSLPSHDSDIDGTALPMSEVVR